MGQRDKYWPPVIFVFFKYVLSTDFNKILLKNSWYNNIEDLDTSNKWPSLSMTLSS